MTRSHQSPAATCTYALRLGDGRYVADPGGVAITASIDEAHLWLWPAAEDEEARAERVAAVSKRYPWIYRATAARSRQ